MAPNETSVAHPETVGISRVKSPSPVTTTEPQAAITIPVVRTPLNLKSEADRLKTFDRWPVRFLAPSRLAAAGFYYLGRDDIVRCFFCGVEIGCWEEGDDPFRDHQRWSPSCPYIRKLPVGNIPLDPNNPAIVPNRDIQSYDTCGPYGIQVFPNAGAENGECSHDEQTVNLEKLGIHRSRGPAFPKYSTMEARLKSYVNWPLSIKQRPDKLSEAGFYYTGKGDQTVCFHCGGGLKDWEETDDPWVEHALWFSKCTYMLLVKGKEFVDKICGEKAALVAAKEAKNIKVPAELKDTIQIRDPAAASTSSPMTPVVRRETANGTVDDGRLCKICYEEELGVVFLPCGHIVACVKCAPSLNTCAVCRKPFTATVRAFLS
ncbi:death-associated inhibitor of apoptosis 1 [Anabrus simplex]|uniref:death-associated inhibitor of apoptosis 1 n=1 Tax=Anabrus simplex TaxID=316456 RepID=UPI0035A3328B